MRVQVGSYSGNGTARSITGAGTISLLLIRGRGNTETIGRPGSKSGDAAWLMGSDAFPATGLITSIDADGFSLGTDSRVNAVGTDYDYIVIEAQSGTSYAGSYTGNATDNRNLTGFGITPAFAVVFSEGKNLQRWKTSSMAGDTAATFVASAIVANAIQALQSDGIQIGTESTVNASGVTFHVFACTEVANVFQVFTFTGDGTDNRSIATGLSSAAEWSSAMRASSAVNLRTPGNSGDSSVRFSATVALTNRIQQHESDGDIQIGSDTSINNSGSTFYGFAFRSSPLAVTGTLSVTLDDFTLSASSKAFVQGAAAVTLGDFALLASAEAPITGSLSTTLDDFALVASAQARVSGAAVIAIDPLTLLATGNAQDPPRVIVFSGGPASYTLSGGPATYSLRGSTDA